MGQDRENFGCEGRVIGRAWTLHNMNSAPPIPLACLSESGETFSSCEGGVGELHGAEDSRRLAFDRPRDLRNGSRAALATTSKARPVYPRQLPT
jgi:hypothetical protein